MQWNRYLKVMLHLQIIYEMRVLWRATLMRAKRAQ